VHEIDENGYIALLIIGADTELARKYIHTGSLKPGFTTSSTADHAAPLPRHVPPLQCQHVGPADLQRLQVWCTQRMCRWFTLGTTVTAQSSGSLSESSSALSRQGPLSEGTFPVSLAAAAFSRSFVVSSASAVLSFASTPGPARAVRLYCRPGPPLLPHRLPRALRRVLPAAGACQLPKSNASF
jgi:hypothetical protein